MILLVLKNQSSMYFSFKYFNLSIIGNIYIFSNLNRLFFELIASLEINNHINEQFVLITLSLKYPKQEKKYICSHPYTGKEILQFEECLYLNKHKTVKAVKSSHAICLV